MKNKDNNFKIQKLFLLLILAIATSSCAVYQIDSEFTSYSHYSSEKKSADEIEYLETVNRPHDVVGSITVNAERSQDFDEVLAKMKKEAAFLGGDAITDIRTNGGTGKWARIKPQKLLGNGHVRANFIASVIVFK